MRLYLKHILKTVTAAPLLPLLILLTLILSVAVAVTAIASLEMFDNHIQTVEAEEQALGNILISARGDNSTRFLFPEDIPEEIADKVTVLGEFSLSAYAKAEGKERTLLSVSALDLPLADRYFDFTFLEYGSFTAENLDRALILSETTARELELHVGDPLTLSVWGMEESYTVQAIVKNEGLLASGGALIHIRGAVRIMARQVPAIASLGDAFTPYSRLLLKTAPEHEAQVLAAIEQSQALGNRRIRQVTDDGRMDYFLFWQQMLVWLFGFLLLMLSGILIASGLTQLRRNRAREIGQFVTLGATSRHLWALQLLENTLHALLGTAGGLLLSVPLTVWVGNRFPWNTQTILPSVPALLFGTLFAFLLLPGLCLPLLWKKPSTGQDEESAALCNRPTLPKAAWILVPLILLSAILCFLLPAPFCIYSGIVSTTALIGFSFLFAPYALRRLCEQGAKRQERRPKKASSPSLFVTLRVLKNHRTAATPVRLLTVLLFLFFTLSVCRQAANTHLTLLNNVFTGETVAMGAGEEVEERIRNMPGVSGVMRFRLYRDAVIQGEVPCFAIAAQGDLEQCLNLDLIPGCELDRKQAILSVGAQKLLKNSTNLTLSVDGTTQHLELVGVQELVSPVVILSEKLLDTGDPICIAFSPTATADEKQAVMWALEQEGILAAESEDMMGSVPGTVNGFLQLLTGTLWAAMLISLAGIANTLIALYRSRRQERTLLALCGMSRERLAWTALLEVLWICGFALCMALPATLLLCAMIHRVSLTAGMVLFI